MEKFATVTAVVFALLAVKALCRENVVEITPNLRELLTQEGGTPELACTVTTKDSKAKLHWDMPSGQEVSRIQKSDVVKDGNKLVYRLIFTNFTSVSVGKYVCELRSETDSVISSSEISIYIAKEHKIEPVFEKDKPAAMSCSISFDQPKSNITSKKWLKNGEDVTTLKDKSFKVFEENNTLVLTEPKREDAGMYVARFEIANTSQPYDCEVQFFAAPLVLDFEKSKNLIQDDTMELQCKVLGYPKVPVTWYKNDKLFNVSTGSETRVQLMTLNGFDNAHLKIKNVEFSDAGDYTCEAYSAHFNHTSKKTITVRVKDRLAALWPFLGIVGEVVVLCTIIFIYEKRRNKRAEQEENTAQDMDGASTDKKEGLRHRNTNNPTA